MISDPPGQSARHRHGINIRVAIIISAEGDDGAVRRKARKSFFAARRAEALRVAAFLGRDPDVTRIDEGNPGRGHVGITKHPRINSRARRCIGLGCGRRDKEICKQESAGQKERGNRFHFETVRGILRRDRGIKRQFFEGSGGLRVAKVHFRLPFLLVTVVGIAILSQLARKQKTARRCPL